MEEFNTTVIVVGLNFALVVRDTVTRHTKSADYYEIEESSNSPEVRLLRHQRLPRSEKNHVSGTRASRRPSLERLTGLCHNNTFRVQGIQSARPAAKGHATSQLAKQNSDS